MLCTTFICVIESYVYKSQDWKKINFHFLRFFLYFDVIGYVTPIEQ